MSKVKKEIVDEIYRLPRRNFPRRKTKMVGIDNLWQMDLSDLQKLSKYNKGYRYLLCIIDTFSRFAFVEAIKTKTGKEITFVFKNLLERTKRKPQLIHVDEGTEFYNKDFLGYLKRNGIHMYSTTTIMKASIVERFQRTFKTLMWKSFAYNGSYNYINNLQTLVDKYNNSPHRSLGFLRPRQVNKKNEKKLLDTVFKQTKIFKIGKFKLNDMVRIVDRRNIFGKGYEANYSTAIFYISKIQKTFPVSYKITDKNTGQTLDKIFYEPELLKTKYPDTYLVEKVLKRKGQKLYVKFLGFDKPEWVNSSDVV